MATSSKILAFDLARESGAAWNARAGCYGTSKIRLGKPKDIENHLTALDDWANDLIDIVEPDFIALKNDVGRGIGSRTLQAYRRSEGSQRPWIAGAHDQGSRSLCSEIRCYASDI